MNDSIAVEQERLLQAKNAGRRTTCRCCSGSVKVYDRHLNHNHAAMLCFLVHLWERELDPIYFRRLEHPFGSKARATIEYFSIMKYWQLIRVIEKTDPEHAIIEAKRIGDKDVPQTGYYVPTPKGVDFAYGRINIHRTCRRFANRTLEFAGPQVSIHDVKNDEFRWSELMGMLI